MRTIEEIKDDIGWCNITKRGFSLLDELIETVATLQREKCAENATVIIESGVDKDITECYRGEYGEFVYANVESILNAKL